LANELDAASAGLNRALTRLEDAIASLLDRLNIEIEASKQKGAALDEAGRRLDAAMAEIRLALGAEKE
jgi:hypothetical protein